MNAQTGDGEAVDTLVCDGKTLRGSIAENASGAKRFIAQVSLYSNSLGVAIAQSTYATDVFEHVPDPIALAASTPSARKVDASPFRSPRGLDGAELCVATARPSRLM